MPFEANYSKWRLAMLALLALGFAALGAWLFGQGSADFEGSGGRKIAGLASLFGVETATMAQILGGICVAMGAGALILAVRNMFHKGPVMRVDALGIYWHRWSETPIPWSNIAQMSPYTISGQKMVGISLVDRSLSPSRGVLGKLGSANKAMGFGDLALSLQGTDGDYEALLAALVHFESRT
jgi:hypothetical protein